MVNLVKYERSI